MATMTCPTEGSQLAAFLQHAYQNAQGGFPPSSSTEWSVRIDDRERSDVSPDFCSMWVLIGNTTAARFTLYLKNPPLDDKVTELISSRYGEITGSRPHLHVEIPLRTNEVTVLRKLATAIQRVVGRGRTYSNPNWKWVCRRTAASLNCFADRLKEYRRLKRYTPWRLRSECSQMPAPRPTAAKPPKNHSTKSVRTTCSSQADGEDLFCLLGME